MYWIYYQYNIVSYFKYFVKYIDQIIKYILISSDIIPIFIDKYLNIYYAYNVVENIDKIYVNINIKTNWPRRKTS